MKPETYRYRIVKEVNGAGREFYFVEYKGWVFWHRWCGQLPTHFDTEREARQKVLEHLAWLRSAKIVSSYVVPPEIKETF